MDSTDCIVTRRAVPRVRQIRATGLQGTVLVIVSTGTMDWRVTSSVSMAVVIMYVDRRTGTAQTAASVAASATLASIYVLTATLVLGRQVTASVQRENTAMTVPKTVVELARNPPVFSRCVSASLAVVLSAVRSVSTETYAQKNVI